MNRSVKYDEDFYEWGMREANLLRNHQFNDLDIQNLAEEIEALSKREYREICSRLAVLICHLLKWQFQPKYRTKSWEDTLFDQRNNIGYLLEDSPSLLEKAILALPKSYKKAGVFFEKDTSISGKLLPEECPYTWGQIMNNDFYPE
jgi:hypothetical protein